MSFAVRNDGLGWRAVFDESELLPGETFSATLPVPSVDLQRAQLLLAVDAERARRWRGGFPVQVGSVTKWFHSDEFSLSQHFGLKDSARDLLAGGGDMADAIFIDGKPVVWWTMDKTPVTITAQIAFDVVAAAKVHQAAIFAASRVHAEAISEGETPDVYANWPPMFGE